VRPRRDATGRTKNINDFGGGGEKNGTNVRKIDLGRKRRTELLRFGFNRFTLTAGK
jgi:hypothetical protein